MPLCGITALPPRFLTSELRVLVWPGPLTTRAKWLGKSFDPDGTTHYAALWQNPEIIDLGTLPGDFGSLASGISPNGQIVVGSTCDSNFELVACLYLSERRDDRPQHAASRQFQPLRNHG